MRFRATLIFWLENLMKAALATAVTGLAVIFSAAGFAAGKPDSHDSHDSHESHAAMPGTKAASAAPMTDGQVRKVDRAGGKVTLSHGPLTHLGMPTGMTMVFRVKEAAWLDQMKTGDRIRFVADRVDGVFTVVDFVPAR